MCITCVTLLNRLTQISNFRKRLSGTFKTFCWNLQALSVSTVQTHDNPGNQSLGHYGHGIRDGRLCLHLRLSFLLFHLKVLGLADYLCCGWARNPIFPCADQFWAVLIDCSELPLTTSLRASPGEYTACLAANDFWVAPGIHTLHFHGTQTASFLLFSQTAALSSVLTHDTHCLNPTRYQYLVSWDSGPLEAWELSLPICNV